MFTIEDFFLVKKKDSVKYQVIKLHLCIFSMLDIKNIKNINIFRKVFNKHTDFRIWNPLDTSRHCMLETDIGKFVYGILLIVLFFCNFRVYLKKSINVS